MTPTVGLLRDVLPGVSRSFGLSLRLLPAALAIPLGVTYLLARAADTIADTRALPPVEREHLVEALRAALRTGDARPLPPLATQVSPGHPSAERRLLERLPDVLAAHRALAPADRARAEAVLVTLTQAMLDALRRFPSEDAGELEALETVADLDRYTYMNAGCVGEFWTGMVLAHRPSCRNWDALRMRRLGARFGQGLQLVNVLRDLPRDLRIGRCYLPRTELAPLGLTPRQLLNPANGPRLRPLVERLVDAALDCLQDGTTYTTAVPRREVRLRVACALPLLVALGTLARLRAAESLLDPAVVIKVPRHEVRRHLAWTPALAFSNRAFQGYVDRLRTAALSHGSPRPGIDSGTAASRGAPG
jgi:farnesyl-diphosphate farnesyltransferase